MSDFKLTPDETRVLIATIALTLDEVKAGRTFMDEKDELHLRMALLKIKAVTLEGVRGR